MIIVSVMYPNTDGSKFDKDYYLGTHIPLVQNTWGDLGLTGVQVMAGLGGGQPGQPATYQVVAQLSFESMDAFSKAATQHGKEIFADIGNFTDVQPVVQISTPWA